MENSSVVFHFYQTRYKKILFLLKQETNCSKIVMYFCLSLSLHFAFVVKTIMTEFPQKKKQLLLNNFSMYIFPLFCDMLMHISSWLWSVCSLCAYILWMKTHFACHAESICPSTLGTKAKTIISYKGLQRWRATRTYFEVRRSSQSDSCRSYLFGT